MLLREGIRSHSTVDKQEMEIFLLERTFWRNVLKRLIDIVIFLAERNLAFRGSDKVLGSPYNGNFLGLFELLAKRDPVLMELKNRIIKHTTKKHYLSNIIQMTVILRFVQCAEENVVTVEEAFLGYLRVDDSTGRGLLGRFMKREEELGLNLANCSGQCYDNGANMKGKEAGVRARLLESNSKPLYVSCASHSLNLVVVDCTKSSTEALLFFGVLAQLYTVFSSSIMNKYVKILIKSPSATRWESRIKCIVPFQF